MCQVEMYIQTWIYGQNLKSLNVLNGFQLYERNPKIILASLFYFKTE